VRRLERARFDCTLQSLDFPIITSALSHYFIAARIDRIGFFSALLESLVRCKRERGAPKINIKVEKRNQNL
jgi:hypothetical protein